MKPTNKTATWILTGLGLGNIILSDRFECSNCKNSVLADSHINPRTGMCGIKGSSAVVKEYPYCYKCGRKMTKDPQAQAKVSESYQSWKKVGIYNMKRTWKADEVVQQLPL